MSIMIGLKLNKQGKSNAISFQGTMRGQTLTLARKGTWLQCFYKFIRDSVGVFVTDRKHELLNGHTDEHTHRQTSKRRRPDIRSIH